MKTKNTKGFTLIELMIVVAIIGILAAIAIPNFLRFQLKAKSSEGKTNLAAIRTAETSYFSEFGSYVSANASPAAWGGATKVGFTNVDGANNGFDRLGWEPEGSVYFNYAIGVVNTATNNAYIASAFADIDADTTPQRWGYRKGTGTTAKGHGAGTACAEASLTQEIVMGCDTNAALSIF